LDVGNKRIALLENQLQDSEREAYQYRIRLEYFNFLFDGKFKTNPIIKYKIK